MEDITLERLKALKQCTFVPGSNPKRFVRDTPLDRELSERQRAYIDILAWTYRRQIPRRLVPAAKPPDLPAKPKPEKPCVSKKPEIEKQKDLFTAGDNQN